MSFCLYILLMGIEILETHTNWWVSFKVDWSISFIRYRTVYPYGLNDQLGDKQRKGNIHVVVDKKFPPLSSKHNKIYQGNSHRNNNSLSPGGLAIKMKLKPHLNHNLSGVPNFYRAFPLAMNKHNF